MHTFTFAVHQIYIFFIFSYQIKVAHFEPDTITLTGEASYPRLSFSISRPAIAPEESSYKEAMLRLKKRHRPKVRAPVRK